MMKIQNRSAKQRVDEGEGKKMRRKDEERREAREREKKKKKRENIFLMEGREKFNKIIFFFLALMNNAHLSIDMHCSNGAKKL